ncbi:hypothetical protein AX16_005315 [Volvariella volvacea WC 439]|nr:hypothetical protein AX16_005315 [Volvariella volvacea WC 439]
MARHNPTINTTDTFIQLFFATKVRFKFTEKSRLKPLDADVVICSADGVIFRLHKRNLEAGCGAFPPASFPTLGEVVHLTESGSTLEILFQFLYPRQQPDWEALDIAELFDLVEAAEKYEVYTAIAMCRILMKRYMDSHPQYLFAYGTKHDYPDFADQAARLLLKRGAAIEDFISLLTPGAVLAWARYQDYARNLIRDAISIAPDVISSHLLSGREVSTCNRCCLDHCDAIRSNPLPLILWELGFSREAVLFTIEDIVEKLAGTKDVATELYTALKSWSNTVERSTKNIPSFTKFLE